MDQLKGKMFIRGVIQVMTGMRIGGSKAAFEIGGLDLNVIKTPDGTPYIPGSSLKGKLRSLLAREEASADVRTDSDLIKTIFGDAGSDVHNSGNPPRIIVRDAFLDRDHFEKIFSGARESMETDWTESKTENRIKRDTGKAEHPRTLERVPAGAQFTFEFVLDIWSTPEVPDSSAHQTELNQSLVKKITEAMRLLEDDYLGGQGSRGYGKVCFTVVNLSYKPVSAYALPDGRELPLELAWKTA